MNEYVRDLLVDAEVFELENVQPDQEGNVPEGTIKKDEYNYKLNDRNLNEDEIKLALLAKQTLYIKTIKNIAIYFLVFSITGIICALLLNFYN